MDAVVAASAADVAGAAADVAESSADAVLDGMTGVVMSVKRAMREARSPMTWLILQEGDEKGKSFKVTFLVICIHSSKRSCVCYNSHGHQSLMDATRIGDPNALQ